MASPEHCLKKVFCIISHFFQIITNISQVLHVNLRAQLYVEYVNFAWFILLGGSDMDVGAVHNHCAVEGRMNLLLTQNEAQLHVIQYIDFICNCVKKYEH